MPRFDITYQRLSDQLGKRYVRESVDLPLDDFAFTTALADLTDELLAKEGELVYIRTIAASEDIPERGIDAGSVVWRDWYAIDLTTPAKRRTALETLHDTYPLWGDVGVGFDTFMEVLAPEPWEVRREWLPGVEGDVREDES